MEFINFEAEVDDNDVDNDHFELKDVGDEEDKNFVDDSQQAPGSSLSFYRFSNQSCEICDALNDRRNGNS